MKPLPGFARSSRPRRLAPVVHPGLFLLPALTGFAANASTVWRDRVEGASCVEFTHELRIAELRVLAVSGSAIDLYADPRPELVVGRLAPHPGWDSLGMSPPERVEAQLDVVATPAGFEMTVTCNPDSDVRVVRLDATESEPFRRTSGAPH